MDKRKSEDVKRLIAVLAFIIIIIILVTVLILITHRKDDNSPERNNTVNNTNNNTSEDTENRLNDIQGTNTSNTTDNTQNSNTIGKLERVVDLESYFWLKDRLSFYYSSNDLDDPTMLMDKEVINELGLTIDNYRKFNDFDSPIFRIDEIYEQILDKSNLYIVKLKIGKSEKDARNTVVWVKKDTDSSTFSIYPYEYLKIKNYLNFQEGDSVPINSDKSIEKNVENTYSEEDDEDIEEDTELCMKGLFERYKFDLLIDRDHLYSILETDYKNTKYSNLDELKKYINDNKTDLYLDMISEYKVIDYNEYVEYRAICDSQRNYVFNVKNMMDYTISLDNYSVIQNKDTYNAFLPAAQAKYCVDRVVQAFNYKDYDFVYSKLNPVQKNNYYKNIDEFKKFLSESLYEQNSYKIDDNYLIISDNVYQFTVQISDATETRTLHINFTMTVNLKENADFTISIVRNDNK